MTTVSGPGPFPGTEPLAAQQAVMDQLVDVPYGVDGLPFLVQLPQRGAGSDPVGRTASLLDELAAEVGPHGWKLADRPGADLRGAAATLRDDLTALGVAAHGYTGRLTVGALGPWSLAAQLYLARGDRVLTDAGAVRDVAASLASGLAQHLADLRAQLPGLGDVVVQLDEPLLGQVAAGVLPTFSGYSRIPAVAGPELVEGLQPVLDAVHAAGGSTTVHVGPAWVGVAPVVLAGAGGVGLDVGAWDERTWETVARAVERGVSFWAGLPRARVSQCAGPEVGTVADALTVPWKRVGLPVARLRDVVLTTPATPLPPGDQAARDALGTLVRVAEVVAERADG
ncbi:hypothetical protein [Luteimicrobium sp. DT211]|uniref:hypothetical protein n=1 Tax=Luteimicrobium sp. DT211 TaxID=3393412 RepID=UPI003CF15C01